MTLGELLKYYESAENPKVFLIDVFSWRGSYSEVAFIPSFSGTKEGTLELINLALTETFEGWKGGEFNYDPWTPVHFEDDPARFDDMALFRLLNA